jgi:hypothetical protein
LVLRFLFLSLRDISLDIDPENRLHTVGKNGDPLIERTGMRRMINNLERRGITRRQGIRRILWNHAGTSRRESGNYQRGLSCILILENEFLRTCRNRKSAKVDGITRKSKLSRFLGMQNTADAKQADK